MEFILKVDSKGRILIPSEIRRSLGIKDAIIARIEDKKIIIEPLKDPIDLLTSSIIVGTKNIEREIKEIRRIAAREVRRRIGERWR